MSQTDSITYIPTFIWFIFLYIILYYIIFVFFLYNIYIVFNVRYDWNLLLVIGFVNLHKNLNSIGSFSTTSKQNINSYYIILSRYENVISYSTYKLFPLLYRYYSFCVKYYGMGSSYSLH